MFKEIVGDITKFEGDVIFNSVGVESDVFGGICKSIVDASKSFELEEQLLKVKNIYKLGEHFVTEGYALKAKYIIHIVVPYYDNDKNMSLYIKSIEMALATCSKYGFKKIGIPLLGSGANKYPNDLVKQKITGCAKRFLLKEGKNGYSVTILLPPEDVGASNRQRLNEHRNKDGDYHSDKTLKQFSKESKEFKKYDENISRGSFLLSSFQGINNLDDYVSEIINGDQFWKGRINRYLGYGTKTNEKAVIYGSNKYSEVAKETNITKDFAFKIIFALQMNEQEATQFLNFFGYTFANNKIEHRDNVIKDLINKRIYGIVEVNAALKKAKYPPLFAK